MSTVLQAMVTLCLSFILVYQGWYLAQAQETIQIVSTIVGWLVVASAIHLLYSTG